jgi:hypothetical protein
MTKKPNKAPDFGTIRSWFQPIVKMEVFKADKDTLVAEYGLFVMINNEESFEGVLPVKYETLEGFRSGIFRGRE